MQLQVVTTSLVVGLVAVGALGAYLTTSIRDGVFDQRLEEILFESASSTSQAQAQFDSATAGTGTQVQQLLNDMLPQLRTGGAGSREVFLWRPENSTASAAVIDLTTAPALNGLVSPQMREQTVRGEGQVWQLVAILEEPGTEAAGVVPGIVVGSLVEVPLAGPFELYYVYSLKGEAETLGFIQRILGAGGITLVGMLGIITWITTRQVVQPVRNAARVAERLADGHLDERLTVRGQDEMATLARSFNEMAASLRDQIRQMEQLSALQRRFVSDVSHELRTPLTTIRMASEVIHSYRDGFDPAVRRSAELLALQLDRFEDLLADLLEISRFDAGAATLEAERRDLRDVVDRATDQAVALAERKGVFLSAEYPPEPAIAEFDPRRVERIVRNLLVNAIEHAEEGPVEITIRQDREAVAVTVRDFGVGMTAEAASHVFDRFWRADPARARTSGGTGLGLAISLEDAHLHAGWLEAWGRPGAGACFRLTLPVRAGIVLAASPLPLVPDTSRPRAGGVTGPTTGQVPIVTIDRHGPSALPDLAALTADSPEEMS